MKWSDPISIRRASTGIGLITFPFFGVLSSLLDAEEGTGMAGSELYRIAASHEDGIFAAGLLFIVCAVLTVPALGILHLIHSRGAVLGYTGGALMLIGAFGHMGYATWQLMLAKVAADADSAAMVAYLDRSGTVTDILLPMMLAIMVGVLLLAFALHRANVVPLWFPILVVGGVAAEFALEGVMSPKWMMVGIWSLMFVIFAYLGQRVLRLSRDEWARGSTSAEQPAPGRPAPAPAVSLTR